MARKCWSLVLRVPLWAVVIPYAALGTVAFIVLGTDLVPQASGTSESLCDMTCASMAVAGWVPWTIPAIELALLACACAAGARRRGGSPGRVTSVLAAGFALITILTTMIAAVATSIPTVGASIDPIGVTLTPLVLTGAPVLLTAAAVRVTYGVALVPVVASLLALWFRTRGPRAAKSAQFAAWLGLTVAGPAVGALIVQRVFLGSS